MSLKPEASTKKSQLIEKASKVLVWDLPVRLFHWLLVIAIGGAWLTAELGPTMMDIHMLFGYSILVLVLFRILWGLVGSYHARFTNFLAGLPRIAAYARTLFSKQPPAVDYLGHNPLGGWMTMVLFRQLPDCLLMTISLMRDLWPTGLVKPPVTG
jgi:cytochrome b